MIIQNMFQKSIIVKMFFIISEKLITGFPNNSLFWEGQNENSWRSMTQSFFKLSSKNMR